MMQTRNRNRQARDEPPQSAKKRKKQAPPSTTEQRTTEQPTTEQRTTEQPAVLPELQAICDCADCDAVGTASIGCEVCETLGMQTKVFCSNKCKQVHLGAHVASCGVECDAGASGRDHDEAEDALSHSSDSGDERQAPENAAARSPSAAQGIQQASPLPARCPPASPPTSSQLHRAGLPAIELRSDVCVRGRPPLSFTSSASSLARASNRGRSSS